MYDDRPEPEHRGQAPKPLCTICLQRRDGWTAVLLRGVMDDSCLDPLEAAIRSELRHGREVVIELAGLDFCDHQGARDLLRLGSEPGVELHGPHGHVEDMLTQVAAGRPPLR